MSNQTEVLTWLEKCKLKVGYSGMPRNAQRAFELGFDEGQAPLLAEIERLKIEHEIKQRSFSEFTSAQVRHRGELQQQLDSLKAKVSEHNICYSCPLHSLGEHHE